MTPRMTVFLPLLLMVTAAIAFAAEPPANVEPKLSFALRDPVVRAIVRKAAEPAKDSRSNIVDDHEIPASIAALKMAATLSRTPTSPVPQQSTCTPVASGGPRGTEMQHVGIASDPLQSWFATQAGYIKGSKGGGTWPCSSRDAGMPSPWTK